MEQAIRVVEHLKGPVSQPIWRSLYKQNLLSHEFLRCRFSEGDVY